jgi:signal transduction histidine kinase
MPDAKILVVDDEQSILDLVTAYLRREGYEVHTAKDGPSALKAARIYRPDLVVLGIAVLATAAELAVPSAFERHMAAMAEMMGGMSQLLEIDFFRGFRNAVTEALFLAGSAAFVAAVILSIFVSRRVVLPVQEMQTASQHIADGHYEERLGRDLQELSRVEAGSFDLKLNPTPVGRLAEGVVDRLGRQFEEKGVGLQVDVPDGLPPVLADEDRIGQVLLNLVGNALQYTPEGGQVRIHARREGEWVRFSVEDTGIGIPPEHLSHLFERFYRVDKSRSRAGGGSGIGLTVARHLVEAHGSKIEAASDGPGQGSTFSFTLAVA